MQCKVELTVRYNEVLLYRGSISFASILSLFYCYEGKEYLLLIVETQPCSI